jgi:sec-independent protein translocase protein TatA
MGSWSWVHWLILIGVALLLFGGRNKISELMGDFARGIKSFREGLKDQPEDRKPEIGDQKSEIRNQKPEPGSQK